MAIPDVLAGILSEVFKVVVGWDCRFCSTGKTKIKDIVLLETYSKDESTKKPKSERKKNRKVALGLETCSACHRCTLVDLDGLLWQEVKKRAAKKIKTRYRGKRKEAKEMIDLLDNIDHDELSSELLGV